MEILQQLEPLLVNENRQYIFNNILAGCEKLRALPDDAHPLELYPFQQKPEKVIFLGTDAPQHVAVILEDSSGLWPAKISHILYFVAGEQWQLIASGLDAGLSRAIETMGENVPAETLAALFQQLVKVGIAKSMYFDMAEGTLCNYGTETPATVDNLDFDAVKAFFEKIHPQDLNDAGDIVDKTFDLLNSDDEGQDD